MRGDRMDM
jgi:regulator of nonsense transcripts 1